jgi:drug/metabolite transporter (DMT)-like permease
VELTLGVTLAVLGAGMLHAGWNALLKSAGGGDALLDTATVVAGSTACSLVALPFLPLPDESAMMFVAASTIIHFGYYLTLAQAYRTGDLSFAYPLMRGTAPLLVTLLGAIFLRELPPAHVIAGILLISIGIIGVAFAQRERHPPAAAWWAFANAGIIAVYTLVDGAGARASGNALSYVVWLTFLEGIAFLTWIRLRRGAMAAGYVRRQWRRGLVGGFCSVAAYAIVLWAMTRAPVAAVSALRETSVIFAALIGALWLKEGFGAARIAGAVTVVVGVAALKL